MRCIVSLIISTYGNVFIYRHRQTFSLFLRIGRIHQKRLKGLGHEINIFLKAYKSVSVFYVHAPKLFKCLGRLVKDKINIKIVLISMKTLTNFKDSSGGRNINLNSSPSFAAGKISANVL